MKFLSFMCVIVFFPAICAGATLRVPSEYSTIQEAVITSIDGDTILVASGTYNSVINPFQSVIDFEYKTDLVVMSEMGPESTIIDNLYRNSCIRFYYSINCKLIGFTVINGGDGIAITLSTDCSVINCVIPEAPNQGIHCDHSRVTISDCIVRSCASYGILVEGEQVTIQSCTIHDNNNTGIEITLNAPAHYSRVIDNSIYNNDGAGLNTNGTYNEIVGNIVHSNLEEGITNRGTSLITNNTVADNGGIGIWITFGSPSLNSNIIAQNTGAGVTVESECNPLFQCNNVWDNSNGNYIGIPDQTGINGNISVDPLFHNSVNGDYTLNLHSPCLPGNHPDGYDCGLIGALGEGSYPSPVEGLTGEPYYSPENELVGLLILWDQNPETNISHYAIYKDSVESFMPGPENLLATRTESAFLDMTWRWMPHTYYKVCAVDSFGGEGSYAILSYNDIYTGDGVSTIPKSIRLSQNYPNPFNPVTQIDYSVHSAGAVEISIFNASGSLVRSLVSEHKVQGNYTVTWNGKNDRGSKLPSGVYFYVLKTGGINSSRKMVMLK